MVLPIAAAMPAIAPSVVAAAAPVAGVAGAASAAGVSSSVIAGVMLGPAVGQTMLQMKAAKEQKNARRLEATRQKVRSIREARIQRARVIAAAESMGVGGSSPAVGGADSITSQTAQNVSQINQATKTANRLTSINTQMGALSAADSAAKSIISYGMA
jgi:hypothetical protein